MTWIWRMGGAEKYSEEQWEVIPIGNEDKPLIGRAEVAELERKSPSVSGTEQEEGSVRRRKEEEKGVGGGRLAKIRLPLSRENQGFQIHSPIFGS